MTAGAGRRRRGRELALRALFELEGTDKSPDEVLAYQAAELDAPADVTAHAARLVSGCLAAAAEVDAAVGEASQNWRLDELGKVERAVLRLGAYELMHEPDVPAAVAIDESIELARAYAGEEAARFVNGVLGRVAAVAR